MSPRRIRVSVETPRLTRRKRRPPPIGAVREHPLHRGVTQRFAEETLGGPWIASTRIGLSPSSSTVVIVSNPAPGDEAPLPARQGTADATPCPLSGSAVLLRRNSQRRSARWRHPRSRTSTPRMRRGRLRATVRLRSETSAAEWSAKACFEPRVGAGARTSSRLPAPIPVKCRTSGYIRFRADADHDGRTAPRPRLVPATCSPCHQGTTPRQ